MAKHRTGVNEEFREKVEALVKAERRISKAVAGLGDINWTWTPYGKPSSGGPFMWNDIIVTHSDATNEVIQAEEYVERFEQQ